jgi:hypothetical protein
MDGVSEHHSKGILVPSVIDWPISSCLAKDIIQASLPSLSHVVSIIFFTGLFLSLCKHDIISPVFEKALSFPLFLSINSYPIFLLYPHHQFIFSHSLLNSIQSGLWPHHSIKMVEAINDCHAAKWHGQFFVPISLDLLAVFDPLGYSFFLKDLFHSVTSRLHSPIFTWWH